MRSFTHPEHGAARRLDPALVGVVIATAGLVVAGLALRDALALSDAYVYKVAVPFFFAGLLIAGLARRKLGAGVFGAANQVTLARAAGVALAAGAVGEAPDAALAWVLVSVACAILVLDGVDGALARARGTMSRFGARFDMETDALLALVLAVIALQFGKAGAYVLVAGLMRYVFVAAGAAWPALRRELPRSNRRQTLCVVQIAGLVLCLVPWLDRPVSDASALAAVGAVIVSFAIDVRWLVAARRTARGEPPVRAPQAGIRPMGAYWLALGAALIVLNFALTFHNVWPTPWITTRHELSVEIALIIALMAAWRGLIGPLPRAVVNAVAVVLVVMCIGRYAEVTAPALYGRRINIYWDGRHMPRVAAMIAEAAPAWLVALGAAALLGLLAGAFYAFRWSLERVHGAFAQAPARRVLGGLAAGLVALYVLGYPPVSLPSWQWFSMPVSTTYWRQAQFVGQAFDESATAERLPPARSFAGYGLEHASGADVLLTFVESYGAVAFDAPEVAAELAPHRERLERAAAATGRRVVSAFGVSPTFGGASWLAHSSFMTGLPVHDQGVYELLLTQPRESLTTVFAGAGYRVVAALPGMRMAWPEGAFYRFDRVYDAAALAYTGPEFGWWRIPDQYSLAKIDELEIAPDEGPPRFVFFATISTHMPFLPLAPYEPDWTRLIGPEPYDRAAVAGALDETPDWTDLRPAYADTLAYTYDYLAGYLEHRRGDDLVLILLGDHQPAASVAGEGARWDVPVHVVASRDAIADALLRAGFVDGLEPAPEPVAPLHELTDIVLGALSETESGKSGPGPN